MTRSKAPSTLTTRQYRPVYQHQHWKSGLPHLPRLAWQLGDLPVIVIGRPAGQQNRRKAPICDPGKKAKRDKTMREREQRLTSTKGYKSSLERVSVGDGISWSARAAHAHPHVSCFGG